MKSYFDYFINEGVPVGLVPVKVLAKIQAEEMAKHKTMEDLNAFYHMMGIFSLYSTWWANQETVNPLAAEVEVFCPTGLKTPEDCDIFMHGFIDLIAENEFGDLGIIDHKTHEGRPWKEDDVYYDIQLMFYLCILWQQGLDPQWVAINSVNVKEYKREANKGKLRDDARFERFHIPKDVLRQRGYFEEILRHIRQMYSPNAEYPRKLEKGCAYCSFKEHCTAEMKGIDGTALLERFKPISNAMSFDLDDLEVSFPGEEKPKPEVPKVFNPLGIGGTWQG
jgi:hypothetical protein